MSSNSDNAVQNRQIMLDFHFAEGLMLYFLDCSGHKCTVLRILSMHIGICQRYSAQENARIQSECMWTENLHYSFHNTNTTHWLTPSCKQAVVFKHSTTPRYCPCCLGVPQSFPAHSQFRARNKRGRGHALSQYGAAVWVCALRASLHSCLISTCCALKGKQKAAVDCMTRKHFHMATVCRIWWCKTYQTAHCMLPLGESSNCRCQFVVKRK